MAMAPPVFAATTVPAIVVAPVYVLPLVPASVSVLPAEMYSDPEPPMGPLKLKAAFTASISNTPLLVTGRDSKSPLVTSCSTSLPSLIVVPPVK